MKTKKRISGTIIRRTVVAVLFSSAIVTFALAVNLSNRSPLDSAERGYGKHDHAAALAGTSRQSRTLSFAERVAYQRAIEEAYWQHRIWPKENADPKPPLDKVMSHEAIGKKVEDYLRDSKALEDYWQRPITPDQLQAEMERIASHTKQPGVLRELFAALSNDPFVIAECLARPVLAERLITELYAHDQRFHGELKHRAEAELANRSVREMKHTSGTYSEIEWVKSDNDNKVAHASRLRDGSAGEAPALQRENTPNAVKLVSTEWNDHVAKLAAAFESSPRRVGPAADADMSAHSKNAPSTFQLFPGRRSLGEGGNASTALPMGKLSPLQEDDARYYAMAVTNKGKDRLKLATIAWLKEPLRSWLAKAEAHVPMTMAAVSANYTLPVISGQSDNSIPSGGPMADKIAPWVMEHTANGQQAEFFVVLSDQADLSHAATLQKKAEKGRYVHETLLNKSLSTQGPILQWLRERGLRGQSFHIVNAILVKGPRDVAETLAARPDVARIEGNPHVQNHFPQPEAVDEAPLSLQGLQRSATIEPGIRYTHAPQVWDLGFTGQGIVVAGADTGIRWTHNALKPHYRGWNGVVADHDYNWHDSIHDSTGNPCGNDSPFPCDDNAHGTHTVGTMVGDDGGENQIGMAPDAKWIGCRNMNQGEGTPARVIECMQWFLAPTRIDGSDPDPTKAPDITNNSWHCPTSEGCSVDSLQAAVEAQAAAGIMMVSAAQNAGPNCSTVSDPPGIYAATYSVGALTTGTDNIAFFSSRGPVTADGSGRVKPDISAPGTFTRSCTNDSDSSYAFFSGTSMATPHIAGAVALLWSAIPSLRHQLSGSRDALNNSAVPIASTECGDAGPPNNVYGWGRVDILAAVGGGSPTPTPIPMACTGDDTWIPTELTNAPDARDGHTAVWTGSEMIVWGGAICIQNVCPFLNTGSRYNPTTDSWTPTSLANAPDARYHPTAVWTGSEMIVWGGQSADGLHFLNTGGKYNPSTNSWTPISTINAPAGRGNHTAVWTGSEMIVWGGCIDVDCNSSFNTGGRYNPSTDSWTPISTINAPPNRWAHTAVWTGSEMIVWGGTNDSTGGRYNPSTDSWRATSTANAPAARDFHTAVWTGSEMIVWGGNNFNTGGKYDPSTDSWTATSTINAPAGREWHTAVWTGSEMIVWGGTPDYSVPPLYTGGRYNPGTDKWTATSLNNAPTRREFHTAVWTGSQMIVWGGSPGSDGTPDVYSGARYCAAAPGPTPTPSPTPTPTATPTATPTPPPPQVETPVISPNGGTFKKKVMVTISDNMPGATIYYTTDGSDPTTSSPVYGATGKKKKFKGIRLKGAGQFTVKAMATAPGFQNSAVASALFTRTK